MTNLKPGTPPADEQVTCPYCHGKGRLLGAASEGPYDVACATFCGTGKVPVVPTPEDAWPVELPPLTPEGKAHAEYRRKLLASDAIAFCCARCGVVLDSAQALLAHQDGSGCKLVPSPDDALPLT